MGLESPNSPGAGSDGAGMAKAAGMGEEGWTPTGISPSFHRQILDLQVFPHVNSTSNVEAKLELFQSGAKTGPENLRDWEVKMTEGVFNSCWDRIKTWNN